MAVVDRQATDDIQPRAWMVTVGDATPNRLVTRVPDQNSNSFGWTDTGIGSLSIGGVAAVAFIDGSTQRQRVFYVKNNGLVMLPYDSDSQGTAVTIAAEAGYTISGDLAAVYWLDGTTKRIIVATGATFNSTAGYTCFFENVNLGASWSVDCSSQVRTTASNLDIVGTVVSNSVEFYFKNNVGGLGRLRRTGNNALHAYEIISAPAAESIMPSVFAIPSQVSSKIELGVITDVSKRVWTGRLTPGQTSPTWIQQPVIPNSDVPVSSGAGANVSIDAMKYSGTFFGNPYTSTNIYVIANWKLYYTNTADDGTWSGQWSTGLRPGDGQLMWGIGATTTTTGDVNRVPRVFLSAGSYTTTLQEFTFVNVFTESLRDHIRKQQAFVEALTSKATESAVAMGPQSGMATAMRRGPEPWACRMDDTTDGANSFGSSSDYEVLRKFTGNWATDPVTDATSGNQFHYVDVEFPVTTGDPCSYPTGTDAVVYRRGTSASYVAGLSSGNDLCLVYSSNGGESGLDHPWVVATEDLAGAVTAHVLFWDVDFSTTRYWKRNAGAACPTGTPTAISTALLPSSPPILLRGGTGGTTYLYGITWPTGADGTFAKSWPTICNFATVPPAAADCGKVGRNLSNGPHPVALDIPYGTAQGSRQGACANVGGGWYKCFEAEQPVSLAASQWTANVIGAVYPAPENGQTAIYFTRSDGASFSTANWRNPPVRIHAAQSTRYYVDPEITVDEEGILFVTWIAITPAPSSTSGSADMYLAYSTDGGETWSSTYDIGGWNANGLPYHCHRREWFLADYRQGTSVGGRALHLLYRGDGTNLYQDSRWLSRWSGMP